MRQMTVHQPPTVVGRLPCVSQTVNIDGRCAVVLIHRTNAPVLSGEIGQGKDRPSVKSQFGAQVGLPRPGVPDTARTHDGPMGGGLR